MKKVYLLAVCAFALFSCQKEQNVPEEDGLVPKGYTMLTLNAVSDVTKTTVDIDGDEGTVKWTTGDEIKVYCSDGSASDFTLVGEGGSTTGSFAGLVPSGKTAVYAVYPNDRYYSVDDKTVVNVTIPDEQEGTFGNANIAVAKIDAETHNMAFKNVNAFVGFTVPADITKVVISSVGGVGNLSGTLAVDCSGDAPEAGALSDGGSTITVTFPESTGGTYYVAIAPGIRHEKGLLLEWYKGSKVSGTYWLNRDITTVVNNVYDMGEVSTSGDYYVTVDGGTSVKNGMSWATAWSASQFWSKIHLTGSDTDKHNAKLANINGATFHFAEGTYNWGADAAISIDDVSFKVEGGYNASTGERDIENNKTIFTGDDDADGTGDHRILLIDGDLNIIFDGITFTKGLTTGQKGDVRFGGAIFIQKGSYSFIDCSFSNNSAVYGGAIRFNSPGDLTLTRTAFSYNTASGDAGALSLAAGHTIISGGSYSNNTAPTGGAIDCFGTSDLSISESGFSYNTANTNDGGAIAVEADATCVISSTPFRHNSATQRGGAIGIIGGGNVKIKSSYFYRNDAHTGGAVYTTNVDSKYANFFVDECSFEANWIDGRIGCIFNIDGINQFSMYNSSARNSYTKNTEDPDYLKGLNPSWIAVDGVKAGGCVSFGNCSIIGDTWDGNNECALTEDTALIALWGDQTNYFTNCIIVPETEGISAIRGKSGSQVIDLYYTHYSNVQNIGTTTDSGGNTVGLEDGNFGSISWSSNCWTWNGQISSAAPTMATKKGVYDRINGICPDFVTWSDTDFVKDQLGNSRGANDVDYWWPGAYQANN